MLIWEDHWQVQWFLGNHCEFGFEVTIANFQWFLRRPSPLNIFRQSYHCCQWFFNGFWFCYHCFQWFSMIHYHWSNDAMVSMDRCGLFRSKRAVLTIFPPTMYSGQRDLWKIRFCLQPLPLRLQYSFQVASVRHEFSQALFCFIEDCLARGVLPSDCDIWPAD